MNYPSNINDKEWECIKHHFTYGKYGNRSRYEKKNLVNAVFYIVKSGSQWRMLPHDFPPWKSVYSFYKRAKDRGIWEKMMDDLVKKESIENGSISKSELQHY